MLSSMHPLNLVKPHQLFTMKRKSSSGSIDILVYRPNTTTQKASLLCYKGLCGGSKYCQEQVYYRNISYLTTLYLFCMSFIDCIIKPTFIVHRSTASKCQPVPSQSNSSFTTSREIVTLSVNSFYILHYLNIATVRSFRTKFLFLYTKESAVISDKICNTTYISFFFPFKIYWGYLIFRVNCPEFFSVRFCMKVPQHASLASLKNCGKFFMKM